MEAFERAAESNRAKWEKCHKEMRDAEADSENQRARLQAQLSDARKDESTQLSLARLLFTLTPFPSTQTHSCDSQPPRV
jgi:hypothetical protein|eukprot:COSAG01_NODE_12036_length_1810_cov_8.840444_2_plen_79_part_00